MIYKYLFLLLLIAFPVIGESPHLMLYFDINKTLIASDRAGNKSTEDILNQLLACEYKSRWDSSLTKPISYDVYIRNILLPGPEHDLELKEKRKAYLDHFIDYLNEHNHPLYSEVVITYNKALEKLQNAQGIVFSSFYRLLEELDQNEISYTLFLRSFGSEVFEIADEINKNYKNKFVHSGVFNNGRLIIDNHLKGEGPLEIYELLNSLTHTAIRDDWDYWMKGGKRYSVWKTIYT